jgi:hypothetical protein
VALFTEHAGVTRHSIRSSWTSAHNASAVAVRNVEARDAAEASPSSIVPGG